MIFKEMKQSEIKVLKEKIWNQNGKKCPVLALEISLDKMVLDHNHKNKSEEYSEHKGTIRTALDFRVNAVLGKLENSIKFTGLDKTPGFNISEFLRNAADYFEAGPYKEDDILYIHPNEVKKEPNISKRQYNKLKKEYSKLGKKKKFPEFPKTGKLTKDLEKLFQEFNISPWN